MTATNLHFLTVIDIYAYQYYDLYTKRLLGYGHATGKKARLMTLMQQILPTKSIAMVEDKRYRWMTRYAKDEIKLNVINLASPYEYGREIIRNDEMKIMWTEFENITVPVSEQYDHLLTRQYKDWRQLPTESQRKSIHISNFNEEVK